MLSRLLAYLFGTILRYTLHLIIIVVILALFVAPVLAQTDTPTPAPTSTPAETPDPIPGLPPVTEPLDLNAVLGIILYFLTIPAASTLVSYLTNFLKRILPETIPAQWIALGLQVAVWVIWMVAGQFGYGELLLTLLPQITEVVRVVLALFGVLAGNVISAAIYQTGHRAQIVGLSYQRSAG